MARSLAFALSLAAIMLLGAAAPASADHLEPWQAVDWVAPDATFVLMPLPEARLCLLDRDDSGGYSANDSLALSMTGGCVGVSDADDVRVASPDGLPHGGRLQNDADVGVPRLDLDLAFWLQDVDGDGATSRDDRVYVDLVEPMGVVDAGDARVTGFGFRSGGGFVQSGQPDVSNVLTRLGAAEDLVAFVDVNGNGRVDATEPLYLDVVHGNADAGTRPVAAGDVRLTPVGPLGVSVGAVVAADDVDAGAATGRLRVAPSSACAVPADGPSEVAGSLYLAVGVACGEAVAPGLIRLVPPAGHESGTMVRAGEGDVGARVDDAPGMWAFADRDDLSGWGLNDTMYLKRGGFGDGRVSAGDLRLSAYGALAGGTMVATVDEDWSVPLVSLDSLPRRIAYLDVDGDGSFGAGEPLYLDVHPGSPYVAVGDVRLRVPHASDGGNGTQGATNDGMGGPGAGANASSGDDEGAGATNGSDRDEESPGPGAMWVVVALCALAARWRRR